jgi:hypothetical protein
MHLTALGLPCRFMFQIISPARARCTLVYHTQHQTLRRMTHFVYYEADVRHEYCCVRCPLEDMHNVSSAES